MPNRSEYPSASMHHEECSYEAMFVGTGASAPAVLASSIVPAADNFAASATRSAAGTYALVVKEAFPRILNVIPVVKASDGALKLCVIVSWVEATKTINVKVWDAATPTAADLAATDELRLHVICRKSLA